MSLSNLLSRQTVGRSFDKECCCCLIFHVNFIWASVEPFNSITYVSFKFIKQTNHRTGKAFDKEISFLGPCNNPQKMRNIEEFSQKRRYRDLSPRHSPSKRQRDKHKSNGNEKSKASAYSQDIREKFSNFCAKK